MMRNSIKWDNEIPLILDKFHRLHLSSKEFLDLAFHSEMFGVDGIRMVRVYQACATEVDFIGYLHRKIVGIE